MAARPGKPNIAARIGGWSAAHWKTAVLLWVAFVVGATLVGSAAGTRTIDPQDQNVGEARRADHMLVAAGLRTDPQDELVLVRSATLTIRDPAFRAVVDDVVEAIGPHARWYTDLRTPYTAPQQVSADRHAAFVSFTMKGDSTTAKSRIDAIVAAVDAVQREHRDVFVGEAGAASTGKALEKMFAKQLEDAGIRSVPLTLLVLLFVFGALVAATLPVALALTAVVGAIGLLAIISHAVPTDPNVSVIVLLVGLAVGVDYSLFYLRRRREERAAGHDADSALRIAAATSGRTVLISGVTVMIAMAGMFFSGDTSFMSFSIGTMTVVAAAIIASLTVLPALLSRLGDGTDRGKIPFLTRRTKRGDSRAWFAIVRAVMRHPRISTATAVAGLLALALPASQLQTTQSGLDTLPPGTPEIRTLSAFEQSFPGGADPARIVVAAPDVTAPAVGQAIDALEKRAESEGVTTRGLTTTVNRAHTAAQVDVALVGDGTDETSETALATLRDELLPATLGQVSGVQYAVGGLTAASHDSNESLRRALPLVFAFVLGFAFLLLLASFRSLVIAATAVVMNLLSVAAAYGVLVLVFQHHWAEGPLDFTSNGGVAPWLPLFLFVILFGLSMDYHVFILSRIREAFDRGHTTEDAIAEGIRTTAGVVTSAAVVMVGAFALFATLPIRDMKEMGVGLAVAVILDATVVRAVLLPATMKLLGEWNWYLPSWLEWLPGLGHGTSHPTHSSAGAPEPSAR